jgi:SOS response regulatory protein OraA/RecX
MEQAHDDPLIKKAAALLAKRAYSRGELRKKLVSFDRNACVEETLNRLEKLKLLNDLEYAYNFTLHHIQQVGWGTDKVKENLLRRDVDPDVIQQAFDRVLNEADSKTFLMDYIEKHCKKHGLPTDPKDTKKLVFHLMRRGFDENQIWGALRQIIPPDVFRYFETGD